MGVWGGGRVGWVGVGVYVCVYVHAKQCPCAVHLTCMSTEEGSGTLLSVSAFLYSACGLHWCIIG